MWCRVRTEGPSGRTIEHVYKNNTQQKQLTQQKTQKQKTTRAHVK